MSDDEMKGLPAYVHKAMRAKLEAEARKTLAEAAERELLLVAAQMDLDTKKRNHEVWEANDGHHHLYRFNGTVDAKSVDSCIRELSTWDRMDPNAPWTIIFNSPGGDVVPGLALFDFLTEMRFPRHHITTVAQGYAASMGGILLQAGDIRVIGRESWVLIHEISAGMMGSFGDLEDRIAWLAKVQNRILDIFTARSDGKKTKEEFENAWKRKDFWLDSKDSLEWGVVDEVG